MCAACMCAHCLSPPPLSRTRHGERIYDGHILCLRNKHPERRPLTKKTRGEFFLSAARPRREGEEEGGLTHAGTPCPFQTPCSQRPSPPPLTPVFPRTHTHAHFVPLSHPSPTLPSPLLLTAPRGGVGAALTNTHPLCSFFKNRAWELICALLAHAFDS